MTIMSITSIIPTMIFGIVLILAWIPVIVLTKGNTDEYKLLESKIQSDLKLTDVLLTYPTYLDSQTIGDYTITSTNISNYNNNLYITINKKTKTTDSNGKPINNITSSDKIINKPLINNNIMNDDDYKYLALQHKIENKNVNDPINSNITYELTLYNIPANINVMKVEGLQKSENQLDMKIYNYEFGPTDDAIKAIKNRKLGSNKLFMWIGRIGTFLMLFGGLSMLISPLIFLNQVGDSLPGPLKLLAIPGKIIASIYETLSFFGSLILTLLMTFFVWSIINYPSIAIIIGGLIIGLMLYFNNK